MILQRFLTYFTRVGSWAPGETTIKFVLAGDAELRIYSVGYDVEANAWTIRLTLIPPDDPHVQENGHQTKN